jgi:hypothetical protein
VPWHEAVGLRCCESAVFCCLGPTLCVVLRLCVAAQAPVLTHKPEKSCRGWHHRHRRRISIEICRQYPGHRPPERVLAARDAFTATLAAAAAARRQALLMGNHPKCARCLVP